MDFARWYLQEKVADRHFAASVLYTDKAAFSLQDAMSCHNLHRCSDENLHATRLHAAQRNFSVNVWTSIVGDCLLLPYILPERMIGSTYITFLQEVLPGMLNNFPMPIRRRIQFHHDGAPAHLSTDIRAHLQATSPGDWIGRGGPIAWPPLSPNLSPVIFL